MALNIKDLPQSEDLDRAAMRSIAGGARTGVRPMAVEGSAPSVSRIVDYPPGFGRRETLQAKDRRPAA